MASLWSTPAPSQMAGRVVLSAETLQAAGGYLALDGLWRYHPGDDPTYAAPYHDDSGWALATTQIGPDLVPGGDWPGIGWFRLYVDVDADLGDRTLALVCRQFGAAEVYLDGSRIWAAGLLENLAAEGGTRFDLRPTIVTLEPGVRHVLAVRHAGLPTADLRRVGRLAGFTVRVGQLEVAIDRWVHAVVNTTTLQYVATSALATLCLFHVLLFVFYPKLRRNLDLSAFSGALAVVTFLNFQFEFAGDLDAYLAIERLWRVAVITAAIVGAWLCYAFVSRRPPRRFWAFVVAGALLAAASCYRLDLLPLVYGFVLAILADIGVYSVTSLRRWRRSLRRVYGNLRRVVIVLVGMAGFAVATTYQILMNFGVLPAPGGFQYPYLLGILSFLMPLSAAYLFHDFGVAHRDLERQLAAVKRLSEETMAQERRSREAEVRRHLLETENARKTAEFEAQSAQREAELEVARLRTRALQAENEAKDLELKRSQELARAYEELQEAHRQLQEAQAQLILQEKMASLGTMVAGFAHEINNPMGAVHSAADVARRCVGRLRDVATDPASAKALEILETNLTVIASAEGRVTGLVESLRNFARLDEAQFQVVDLREGLESSLTLIGHQLATRIRVERDYGDIPKTYCAAAQINQVFLNVLRNAVQAITDQGTIVIHTGLEGERIEVRIADTGTGIEPGVLARIFDLRFSAKAARVKLASGLSMAYRIVQEHDGELRIDSAPGEGTRVSILLPVRQAGPTEHRKAGAR